MLKCLAILPCDLSSITIHISDCRQFSVIHISQGSVATYLWCGGIFKYEFVANLPLSLSVKIFENRKTFLGKLYMQVAECNYKNVQVVLQIHNKSKSTIRRSL